jgi:hypothetical protein
MMIWILAHGIVYWRILLLIVMGYDLMVVEIGI